LIGDKPAPPLPTRWSRLARNHTKLQWHNIQEWFRGKQEGYRKQSSMSRRYVTVNPELLDGRQ
jgi:hypothetical protein